jgi:hypothetical protein
MFFFFIGGIQPKKVEVDKNPRLCPTCGLPQARLKRIDHYISLFFIPLIPVKRGPTFLECQRCGVLADETMPPDFGRRGGALPRCPACGVEVDRTFSYCPYCGRKI